MATITEDYASFETAKLLKEKGFNGLCNAYYDCFTTNNFHSGCEPTDFNSIDTRIRKIVSAPTLQMTLKWLREVHYLFIEFKMSKNTFLWGYRISISNGSTVCLHANIFNKYEEAAEAAIKYCLENLI